MDPIMFRAKEIHSRKWVIGFLVRLNELHDKQTRIYTGESFDDFKEVDTKTVGQYTGVHDKKGRPIFTGDILVERHAPRLNNSKNPKTDLSYEAEVPGVPSDAYRFVCAFREGSFWTSTDIFHEELVDGINYNVEVIGNIHDNPELIAWKGPVD